MVLSGTYLITQVGLNDAGVNLDLSIKDAGKVTHGPTGARNAKEGPVEYFDLSFGNRELPCGVGRGGRDHIILNLLRGRRVSEEELVREIGHLLDDLFEGGIFLAGREIADTQAVIDRGLDLSPECRVQRTLTGLHPTPTEGARE